MDVNKITKKVSDAFGKNQEAATKLAAQLMAASPQLHGAIETWSEGQTPSFEHNGITLEMICSKESCSIISAILRMNQLMNNPTLCAGYPHWEPVNKDWGRG